MVCISNDTVVEQWTVALGYMDTIKQAHTDNKVGEMVNMIKMGASGGNFPRSNKTKIDQY